MKNISNVMIDVETLGVKEDCVILSIAAVRFDIFSGKILEEFYREANIKDQYDRKIEASTLYFWLREDSDELIRFFKPSKEPLIRILSDLTAFTDWAHCNVWANSPSFDLRILKNAIGAPLCPFYNERDVRTVKSLKPNFYVDNVGTHHNALNDCKYQINLVVGILNSLSL